MAKIDFIRCEYLKNPIGISVKNPKITWSFKKEEQDKFLTHFYQKEFKIKFSINNKSLNKETPFYITSNMNFTFLEELKSKDKVFYKIIVKDNFSNIIESEINSFEMGILNNDEFIAKWIRGDYRVKLSGIKRYKTDYFFKNFFLDEKELKRVKKARIYASSLGLYEIKLNERKVGDYVLTPGSTDYRKRIQYQTYDCLPLLKDGENKINVTLGDGWFRGNNGGSGKPYTFGRISRIFFELHLMDEENNLIKKVVSDKSWKWSNDGPIIFNDIKDGEKVDASLIPSFKGKAKVIPSLKNKKITKRLVCSNNFPLKEKEIYEPIKEIITPLKKHILVFENNLAGYISFKINAKKGDKIHLVLGEYIDNNGEFSLLNIQDHVKKYGDTPKQEITYICKDGLNEYKSKFFYGGFRYCLIETNINGYDIKNFKQVAIYNDFELTSSFECSNNLINIFYKNTLNSFKSNSVDVPTDCPTRERAGWTGDSQIFFNTASYLANFAPFIKKHLADIYDRQTRSGKLPCMAPTVNEPLFILPMNGSVGWADAGILIPYFIMKKYGDNSFSKENYKKMKKYINFMIKRIGKSNFPLNKKVNVDKKFKKFLVRKGQSYGEWTEPEEIFPYDWKDIAFPHVEVSTAYTHYVLKCFKEIEINLNHFEEASKLDKYIEGTKKSYQALVETEEYSLNTKRQACLVRPLYMHLLTEKQEKYAKNKLLEDLNDFSWRIGTGFLSTPYILFVLNDINPKYAYKLLENEEAPGWLYMAKNSTSSIWESWEGVRKDYGLSSLNHYTKGTMVEFSFSKVLGINVLKENYFEITPSLGGSLTYAKGFYYSLYGKVEVSLSLNKEKNKINIKIDIPYNTKAKFIYDNEEKELENGSYDFILDYMN